MNLRTKSLEAISNSMRCRNRLALEMEVSGRTIERWLKDNDIMLTTAKALQIIMQETGLQESELFETAEA